MYFANSYAGKRVFVTGHTGFKGSWLSEWLLSLGAEVTGYSLEPPTTPALFDQLGLQSRLTHIEADVRDKDSVVSAIRDASPDYVFHLAAQSLVRFSYKEPIETFETNVLGTANVLEALKLYNKECAAVVITTDKCYENREWLHGYREGDPLGGHDPYSASKAAAELVVAAYRLSFFGHSPVKVASARAGNVIGGGDWALDRLVPDAMRALGGGQAIPVRNRGATRPWQHVLEPLSGYLWLAATMANPKILSAPVSEPLTSAFNFGPGLESNAPVSELVEEALSHWPGEWEDHSDANAPHEANLLHLSTDKAFHVLEWKPVWDIGETIEQTVTWYRDSHEGQSQVELTQDAIASYVERARELGILWARH